MAKPETIVAGVSELVPQVEAREGGPVSAPSQLLTVTFENGTRAMLDLTSSRSKVWAEVLASLREAKQPAYVEIDPETHLITQLLLPRAYTIARMDKIDDGWEIQFIPSHARHVLRRSHPDFAAISAMLQNVRRSGSTVLVTETLDTHELIDLRPISGESAPPPRSRRRRQR